MIRFKLFPMKEIVSNTSDIIVGKSKIHTSIHNLAIRPRCLPQAKRYNGGASYKNEQKSTGNFKSSLCTSSMNTFFPAKRFSTTPIDAANVEESSSEGTKNAPEDLPKEPYVLTERIKQFHIMTISMNRGRKRNCVNKEMAQELLEAFNDFEADDEMYCAVFHGLGGNFSAGYDLEELADIEESQLATTVACNMMDRGPMGPTRIDFKKPVIAAIEGWCVAGGLELALMADLRVADSDAKLGFLNRRFGVPLLDGGSVRLPELIGLSRAMDLILTGRIVEAEEAHTLGLVNYVTKTGAAYGRAMHLAKEITAHPQACLMADRASAIYATFASKSLEDSLDQEGMNGLHVLSKESIKGAKKFVSGLGKHGKFNVTPVAEKQEWQKEFEEMVKTESK